jgi:hypothetical protein
MRRNLRQMWEVRMSNRPLKTRSAFSADPNYYLYTRRILAFQSELYRRFRQ